MRYNQLTGKTKQERIWKKAIDEAMNITSHQVNGDLKLKVINLVLIDKTATTQGAADSVYYSEIQVKRWIGDFVRLAGKKAGY